MKRDFDNRGDPLRHFIGLSLLGRFGDNAFAAPRVVDGQPAL